VKPARFAYFRPQTLEEALELLRAGGDGTRVLAGGQSLVPLLSRRLARPTAVIDLKRVPDLRYVTAESGGLRIGALTRHADIEDLREPGILAEFGVLPETARLIGHLPVRTRGTIGGSLAHADPRAEWPLLAVALDARIVATGGQGAREVPAGEFFTGTHRTALRPGEIVTEIRFPTPGPGTGSALAEFGEQAGALPVVAAAASLRLDGSGRIEAARIALGGVADRPVRAPEAESAALGAVADDALFGHVAAVAAGKTDPPPGHPGGEEYRRELAATLVTRALRLCAARCAAAARPGRAAHPETAEES
jgi:aerobic carbon-monoxide dehydrogenase medium subunit